MYLTDSSRNGPQDMDGNGVIPACNFDEKLCKMFELSDEVVVDLLDVKEDLFDCFYLLAFVELFQGKVHALRVIDRDLFKDFMHMFFLIFIWIGFFKVSQSQDLGKPNQE